MIVFDMECSKGHVFEGWFNSIESFEEQDRKNLIACPYCNDSSIRKVISPVAMKGSSSRDEERQPDTVDYARLAKEVVEYINRNFEDVGTDFAREALKMHYSVTEKRNIRGSATEEEEKTLKEEGVDFFKIPVPKIDGDKKN
ncbi:MAG: DUF1178 family protein [Deltaproteobacteria bacterium]|nr:DUF1178 family protein [Deltaproteobacteria bacterium]MBW2138803.1 DUF1178 family protein [Deltaproteobacteria bacterium]